MTTYHWTQIRDETIALFGGDTPGAQLEQDLATHFAEDPDRFLRTRDKIADRHARHPLRSPLAVLRSELNKPPVGDITADNTHSHHREKMIAAAERWIRQAGLYLDSQTQLEQALFEDAFGDHGQTLRPYADDQTLRRRMTDLWDEYRPIGQQTELEAETYMRTVREQQKRLVATPKVAADHADLEPITPTI